MDFTWAHNSEDNGNAGGDAGAVVLDVPGILDLLPEDMLDRPGRDLQSDETAPQLSLPMSFLPQLPPPPMFPEHGVFQSLAPAPAPFPPPPREYEDLSVSRSSTPISSSSELTPTPPLSRISSSKWFARRPEQIKTMIRSIYAQPYVGTKDEKRRAQMHVCRKRQKAYVAALENELDRLADLINSGH